MNLTAIPNTLLAGTQSAAPKLHGAGKLHEAAQQFESLMINEMLKSAKTDSGWLDSEGETGQDTAMDMAQTQFATALAKSGGLGLSRMIEKTVHPK